MNIGIYVLVALVALALVVVKKTIVIIPQSETKIIERLDDILLRSSRVLMSSFLSLTMPRILCL